MFYTPHEGVASFVLGGAARSTGFSDTRSQGRLGNVHILPCGSVLASSPSKAAKQVKNRAKGAFAQKDPVRPFMGVFLVCVRCWICCKNSAFGVFQDMPSAELLYGKAGMGSSSCSPKTLCWVKAISLLSSMPEKMEATLQGHPEQGRLGNSQ